MALRHLGKRLAFYQQHSLIFSVMPALRWFPFPWCLLCLLCSQLPSRSSHVQMLNARLVFSQWGNKRRGRPFLSGPFHWWWNEWSEDILSNFSALNTSGGQSLIQLHITTHSASVITLMFTGYIPVPVAASLGCAKWQFSEEMQESALRCCCFLSCNSTLKMWKLKT